MATNEARLIYAYFNNAFIFSFGISLICFSNIYFRRYPIDKRHQFYDQFLIGYTIVRENFNYQEDNAILNDLAFMK